MMEFIRDIGRRNCAKVWLFEITGDVFRLVTWAITATRNSI
jgi:hypothetical protein